MKLGWYLHRLRRMSATEVAGRLGTVAQARYWRAPRRRPNGLASLRPGPRRVLGGLPRAAAPAGTPAARELLAAADRLLDGTWPLFHLHDATVGTVPEWFRDPLTGTAAPRDAYSFAVPYRDEARVGNIKFVWEMSRHQPATLLATAWWITGNDAYAERAAEHLRSWWEQNPFLTGVHWTSGIEAGLRLLSWTWIRLLLADWPGAPTLFEANDAFARQLFHHQVYIRRFGSRGSSANNHRIAELAGLAASATAFPWFAQSARWARQSRLGLVAQAEAQTHADGFNREQASGYHVFVFEMLAAATLAARLAARPFPPSLEMLLCGMADALAATLDTAGHPPRFGDGDEGRGLLLDDPARDPAATMLDVAGALFGPAPGWPDPGGSIAGHIAALLAPQHQVRDLPRPASFPGAGITILRDGDLWLRCDAGPHGFLSIAAHGHADALAFELRAGGVQVFADPGTYCYHGEPAWRAYFKGTSAHNTLLVDGADQAVSAGPFLWRTHPLSTLVGTGPGWWQASHDGYGRLPDPVTHHRRTELHDRRLTLRDWLDAAEPHDVTLLFHLGADIAADLTGSTARLHWPGGTARATLPPSLSWTLHRGETDPPLGWYSRHFGQKQPAYTLAGRGRLEPEMALLTSVQF